jgi:hypothetical protein
MIEFIREVFDAVKLAQVVYAAVVLLCQCAAVFGAEPYRWQHERSRPVTPLAPVPNSTFAESAPHPPVIEKPIPQKQVSPQCPPPSFGDVLQRAVTIRNELPKGAFKGPRKKALVGLSPAWCQYCYIAEDKFKTHPLYVVDWQTREHSQCDVYPAIYDPETRVFFHEEAMNSWDTLIAEINDVRREKNLVALAESPRTLSVGTISRETVLQVLQVLGAHGSASLGNDVFSYSQGMFAVRLPANVALKWTTTNDLIKFEFSSKPSVGISGIKQTVSAVTISPDLLTLQIDWFPDVTLDLK